MRAEQTGASQGPRVMMDLIHQQNVERLTWRWSAEIIKKKSPYLGHAWEFGALNGAHINRLV